VQFDRSQREFLMPVLVTVYPDRLRRPDGNRDLPDAQGEREERLKTLIGRGLRAQLRTGNLLTGQVYVALDFFPKEKAYTADVSKKAKSSVWNVMARFVFLRPGNVVGRMKRGTVASMRATAAITKTTSATVLK